MQVVEWMQVTSREPTKRSLGLQLPALAHAGNVVARAQGNHPPSSSEQ